MSVMFYMSRRVLTFRPRKPLRVHRERSSLNSSNESRNPEPANLAMEPAECIRGSSGCGKLHEHVRDVLPFGDEEVVWNLGWDVNQVTWCERMPLPVLDSRA